VAQRGFRYLPIHDVIRMSPSGVTHVKHTAFLLIIVEKDCLLTVLVLEVTPIDVGKGLLINLRRYAIRFSMMIGDLKKELITHPSFGASPTCFKKPGRNTPSFRYELTLRDLFF